MNQTRPGILQLNPDDVADLAIVVGDPNRARGLAEVMEDARLLSNPREYHTYAGRWKGKPITVSSHGVGGGGASICFEELIQAGVKVIIRAGTCGSFRPEYREGSLIIATGAVRNDGVSENLIPLNYPAIADYQIVSLLVETARLHRDINFGVGLCVSDGVFYGGLRDTQHERWAEAHVLAVEMEVATLLTIAGIRGIRAGAILNVDNYIFERETYLPDRDVVHQGTARMLQIVLDTIIQVDV